MHRGCHNSLKHMLPLESHFEAYAQRCSTDESLDNLDEFFEQLAGNASLIAEACPRGDELSILDACGGDTLVPLSHKQHSSIRDIRDAHACLPPRPPKLVRTPEQILERLFQRSEYAERLAGAPSYRPACRATLPWAPQLDCQARQYMPMPASPGPVQTKGAPVSSMAVPVRHPSLEGTPSLCGFFLNCLCMHQYKALHEAIAAP